MAEVGVYRVRTKGRVYVYAWRGKGAPRIYAEEGTPEFVAELAEALASRKTGDRARVSGLCAMFRASDAWLVDCSAKTRASWSLWLDRIQDHFGELRIEQFDRPAMKPIIRRWHASYKKTPRAADMGLQVLSRLLTFGMAEGKLATNATTGIPRIYDADRSELIWTQDDLAKLKETASAEVYQAAKLASLTGLRQSDLLRLSWSHIKPLSIEIATGKSGGRRTTVIPLYGELKDYLATIKKRATTVLVNTEGQPWKTGFGSSWGRAMKGMKDAGCELHFHDLRGTAATRFYLGGLSIRQIAEAMAWSEGDVEPLINRYVKRDEVIRDMIAKMDRERKEDGL